MEKAPPTKRPRYDAAFRAEALRLASGSRSTRAAAHALTIGPKRRYARQKAAQPPLPADPAEAAAAFFGAHPVGPPAGRLAEPSQANRHGSFQRRKLSASA